MTTCVAILNWNGLGHLKTYLPSVVEHSSSENVEILLIDNGSTDDSCDWVEDTYPSIRIKKLLRIICAMNNIFKLTISKRIALK